MKPDMDWEAQLRETLLDLPKERWAALEVDLMSRLREPERADAGWMERLAGWWGAWLRPGAVGISLACLLLSVGWWMLRVKPAVPGPQAGIQRLESWGAGELLHSDTLRTLAWGGARCTVSLRGDLRRLESKDGTRLRLENGSARFGVEPRRPGEVFSVEFGDCKATVVGTAFTVRVDSAGGWAGVEHGKVRVETGSGWSRFLTQGDGWSCREPGGLAAKARDTARKTMVPGISRRADAARETPGEDREWTELWDGCMRGSERCMEGLAAYLKSHPTGAKAAKAALLWADRSQQAGDLRDALYALELAAHAQAGEPSFAARLRTISLKASELRQKDLAIKELDALIASLPDGVERARAARLRAELVGEKGAESVRPDLP